jgi:hypothetical protein
MRKEITYKILLLMQLVLLLQACNAEDLNMDKCRPPMFSFGAVLNDARGSNYKDAVSIHFTVSSNSSVTTLSDISVTIHYPKEVTLRHKIYDNVDENVTMLGNTVSWKTKSIAGYKERGGSIPITIKNGVLRSPIICEAKVTYIQRPGCEDGGMMDATYVKTVELTTTGRKDSEWGTVSR